MILTFHVISLNKKEKIPKQTKKNTKHMHSEQYGSAHVVRCFISWLNWKLCVMFFLTLRYNPRWAILKEKIKFYLWHHFTRNQWESLLFNLHTVLINKSKKNMHNDKPFLSKCFSIRKMQHGSAFSGFMWFVCACLYNLSWSHWALKLFSKVAALSQYWCS